MKKTTSPRQGLINTRSFRGPTWAESCPRIAPRPVNRSGMLWNRFSKKLFSVVLTWEGWEGRSRAGCQRSLVLELPLVDAGWWSAEWGRATVFSRFWPKGNQCSLVDAIQWILPSQHSDRLLLGRHRGRKECERDLLRNFGSDIMTEMLKLNRSTWEMCGY